MSRLETAGRIRVSGVWLSMLGGMILAGILAAVFVTDSWDFKVFRVVVGADLLPKIQLWLMLIMTQAALWVGCAFYLFSTHRRLGALTALSGRHRRAASLTLLPAGLLLILLAVKQAILHAPLPPATLGGFDISKLPVFGGMGTLIAAWAIWEMYVASSIWRCEFHSALKAEGVISRYLELREIVLRLLFLAGVVLAVGTLAGAALRSAVNADKGPNYFPQEYVVIYGAIYSLLLLVGYAPVYAQFLISGTKLAKLCAAHRQCRQSGSNHGRMRAIPSTKRSA